MANQQKKWNTECFEVPIYNGSVLEWLVIAIAMVPTIPTPNHWKSQQNGHYFDQISNGFGQNGRHFVKKEFHWKTEGH